MTCNPHILDDRKILFKMNNKNALLIFFILQFFFYNKTFTFFLFSVPTTLPDPSDRQQHADEHNRFAPDMDGPISSIAADDQVLSFG